MNRLLLALNIALAVFLVFRIVAVEGDIHAAGPAALDASQAAIEASRVYDGDEHRLSRLVLELRAPLAESFAADGDAPDLGLRLEPDFPMTAFLSEPDRLELDFPSGLPRARSYGLHASRPLSLLGGGAIEPGLLLSFATPAVRLDDVAIDAPNEDGLPALVATFDLPTDLAAVRQHLQLRDSRTGADIPVDVAEDRWGVWQFFRVTPRATEVPDDVTLSISAGLRSRGAEIATDREQSRQITLRQPLFVTGAEFDAEGIKLSFNHAISPPADGLIELEPAIPFKVFGSGVGLRITGEFPPGGVFAVKLRKGFPGDGRVVLQEDERRSLLVPDRSPEVGFARRGSVLSARAEPVLEVRTVNVEQLRVRARRVYENNVVRMLQRGDSPSMSPEIACDLPVQAPRNQDHIVRVDLRTLLTEAAPRGLWWIDVRDADERWRGERRLIQLTDLGVTVRAAADAAAVQVVSIADGGPVVGAEVAVLSPTNQVLATGATDSRGVALLHWPVGAEDHKAYLVQVRGPDGDQAFVDMASQAVELSDPTLGGRPFAKQLPEAWVWPTRGIVRPGERIEAAILVRDAAGEAVAGRDVVVAFDQPNGRTWRRKRVTTPGSGLVTATLDTSADAPSGTWRVRVLAGDDGPQLGVAPVQVEAFVPYRLEAEVSTSEPLRFGGSCVVRVAGRWLDGAPAAGRPVEVRVRLMPGTFAPESAEGFSFDSGSDAPPPGELPALTGVLGEDGTAELRLPLPADATTQALTALVLAEVTDPSGRIVRAATQAPVLRADLHLGVRATTTGIELRAIAADGTLVSRDVDVKVRLERRRHVWGYESLSNSRWRWVTRVDCDVLEEWPVTLTHGVASLPLTVDTAGGWLAIVATAGGVTAEQVLGKRPPRPDRLRVEAPAEPIAPGAVATIAVTVPAAGRGFVTLEGPTVLDAHVVDLQQGRNEVSVPVPAAVRVPNLHVVVTLTRPARSVGPDQGPAWLVGGTALPLARSEIVGPVTLRAPAEVLPEAELTCEVSAPGATSAVVAVVDEGVLAVTHHADPDPIGYFLARRRLAVAGADAFAALMEGASYVAGTRTGGDGDQLSTMLVVGSISPRIRPLARFAEVMLDRDGHGTVAFPLPPYEGRVRVMAIAAGPKGFGSAASATVVKAPLGLLTAVPRMVAPGDRFSVPVTLRNDTGADGVATLCCSAADGVELVEAANTEVPLRAGEVQTVEIALRATELASAATSPTLRFEATLGDTRRSVTEELHVRVRRLLREDHVGVRLDQAAEIRVPDDFDADGLTAVLRIDAAPDAQLRPALEALISYPYGCVEQTTSRGFALLACQALLPRIYGGDVVPIDASELVQAACDRLAGMQSAGGGFGWWPNAREEYGFGTLYAMDFLVTAREQGYRVPESVLRAGLVRVRAIADAQVDGHGRALAWEIASRVGMASRGPVEWLATQAPDAEDCALLAMTLHRLGDKERALELLATGAPGVLAGEPGGRLRSPLRQRASRFRARLALDPADPVLPELAWVLQQELLHPDRLTTQEMAQALRALASYYAVSGGGDPAQLRGQLDGEPLPEPIGDRIELPVRPGSVLAIGAGGRGFALLTIRGHRPPRATSGDGSLRLQRTIVDPVTGTEVAELQRGRVYEVRLAGTASRPLENLVFVDLLPGGLEPEAPPPDAPRVAGRRSAAQQSAVRIERRDDRVLLFHPGRLSGDFAFSHLVRATFPGSYTAEPPIAEAMYDAGARFVGASADGVEVRP